MIRIPRLSVSEFFTNSIGKEMNEMKRTKNWICMAMCLLLVLLAGDRVGRSVPVKLVRGGELTEVEITVGERG